MRIDHFLQLFITFEIFVKTFLVIFVQSCPKYFRPTQLKSTKSLKMCYIKTATTYLNREKFQKSK